jgi:hypothetical protein
MDFTVTLTDEDWDHVKGGWRCPALQIPETKIETLYVAGAAVDPKQYSSNTDLCLVRWGASTHPKQVAAHIHVGKALSTSELTSRWKKAAIILPILGALGAAWISARLAVTQPVSSTKQVNDGSGLQEVFESSNDFLGGASKFQFVPLLESSKREAWFVGTTFYISVDQFYGPLLKKLSEGVNLYFLILNPDGKGTANTARMLGVGGTEIADQCTAGIRILIRMSDDARKANYPGAVYVKLVDDELTSRLYLFDPKTDGGTSFFVMQVAGTNSQTLPGFVFSNSTAKFNSRYFDAVLKSWNSADAISLETWRAAHPGFK